ncbi:MAG: PHP domain-containing protein [Candidatus Lokiarchaeota archaeon]|nr:PHP domain-containing protein [Candidatus Lokiarchaeota archaeon]
MKAISDYHVHTSASHCCKEHYGPADAWDAARDRGIEHLGITDHDVPFKNGYLAAHERAVTGKEGLLLGLEVSIRDGQGRIQVAKRDLERLDYVLLAEHVHIMPTWTFLRRGRKAFSSWWRDPSKRHLVEKFYDRHSRMTCLALERNRVDVLAHPWRFPWHQGLLDKASLQATERVVSAAVGKGVRVEVSRIVITMVLREVEHEQGRAAEPTDLPPWKGDLEHEIMAPAAFFRSYFEMCRQLGAEFTLGSDAHKLADVGRFGDVDAFLLATGLREKDIVQDLKA